MVRRLISACCATTLALLAARVVWAAPPEAGAGPSSEADTTAAESDAEQRVDQAIEAWRQGDWTEVRDLLEPLMREGDGIDDPLLRESALRYLAEATLLDEGLDPSEREELARGYVTRLLDASPDWSPPSGLHGRAFYDLVALVRSERDSAQAEACRGQLLACKADLTELRVDHEKLEAAHKAQDVAVRDVIKRNRGLALIPLGIGHFTNDNPALGGTFLGLELASGIAGLSLLIYRVRGLGCVRTNGFASGSLVCPGGDEEDVPALQVHIQRVRKAEEAMAWVFLGSVALDIVLAQVLFEPITVVDRGKMTREQLDRETAPVPAADDGRRKRKSPSAKLELRPSSVILPGGAGLGVHLRF